MDDIADDAFAMEGEASTKFMSIILTNLQTNYDGWKAELPPEDREEMKKKEEAKAKEVSNAEVRSPCCIGHLSKS